MRHTRVFPAVVAFAALLAPGGCSYEEGDPPGAAGVEKTAAIERSGAEPLDTGPGKDCRDKGGAIPCGTCDPNCKTEGLIAPSPTDTGASGLAPNPDGPGVVLGIELIDASYAWIAHFDVGEVSKVDLRSAACVGRFKVGTAGTNDDSPSRTTVDGIGNAYIVNRGGGGWSATSGAFASVTKIAGDRRFCVDRNGDGVKGNYTSSSCSDVKGLGTDECVLWTKVFTGERGARGVAVDFGDPTLHPEGYAWVGLAPTAPSSIPATPSYNFYQLDPGTGSTMGSAVRIHVSPYGSSIDSKGNIWSTHWGGTGGIQAFNAATRTVGTPVGKPSATCGNGWGYGITVDLKDRVWVGFWGGSGRACRYDPVSRAWTATKSSGTTPGPNSSYGIRGMAVDLYGNIWAADYANWKVYKFNAETAVLATTYTSSLLRQYPLGMGIDAYGKVWVSDLYGSNVDRLDPVRGTVTHVALPRPNSYTYSDFTGMQRSMRNPRGQWVKTFARCPDSAGNPGSSPQNVWDEIGWDVTTPSNSQITIKGRSADTIAGIVDATPVVIAMVPPATSPKSIVAAFSDARVYLGKYLEITAILDASTDGQSPVFVNLYTTYKCY